MEAFFTSQEILVVIHTKFAAAEYQDKDEEKGRQLSPTEKLADACWNGMLRAKLPEITQNRKPLPIWELNEGDRILYVKLGEIDNTPDTEYTINPYKIAMSLHLN